MLSGTVLKRFIKFAEVVTGRGQFGMASWLPIVQY